MDEVVDYNDLLLTIEEFKKDQEVYDFYDGDYGQYIAENYVK